MGLNHDDFVKALKLALSDDSIIEKLTDVVTNKLKFELDSVIDINNQLKRELSRFTELNTSLQKEVSDLREVIKKKNEEISSLNNSVSVLQLTTDELEQYSRRNTLRVSGVLESENEDIVDNMLHLFNDKLELDPPLTHENIDRIHRVGKPNASHPWQILVKFSTYNARQSVYSEKKNLRNSIPPTRDPEAESQDDTAASHEDEVQQPKIYLNEDLTKRWATLLWEARKLVRAKKFKTSWSFHGRILIENRYGRIKTVNSVEDIQQEIAD